MKILWTAACAVVLGFASTLSAQAAPFVFSTPNAPLPAFAGQGLNGEVWTNVQFPSRLSDRNLSFARTIAPRAPEVGVTPDGVFRASLIDYPQGPDSVMRLGDIVVNSDQTQDWQPTATVCNFLGSDCASLTPGVGATLMHPSTFDLDGLEVGTIFRFSGYLRVDLPNTSMQLDIGSDDGSELFIQNVRVLANDGVRAYSDPTVPADVLFLTPGLYAMEILYFEAEPEFAGITFGDNLTQRLIPTASLYQTIAAVPEPATLAAMLAGLGALAASRRRAGRALTALRAFEEVPERARVSVLASGGGRSPVRRDESLPYIFSGACRYSMWRRSPTAPVLARPYHDASAAN